MSIKDLIPLDLFIRKLARAEVYDKKIDGISESYQVLEYFLLKTLSMT